MICEYGSDTEHLIFGFWNSESEYVKNSKSVKKLLDYNLFKYSLKRINFSKQLSFRTSWPDILPFLKIKKLFPFKKSIWNNRTLINFLFIK